LERVQEIIKAEFNIDKSLPSLYGLLKNLKKNYHYKQKGKNKKIIIYDEGLKYFRKIMQAEKDFKELKLNRKIKTNKD